MHKLHLHLILLSLFFCCFFPASSSYASVILNPNSGNNNHTRINAALSDDSKRENGILTVYLSKGTYAISDTIYLGRDTVLTGDKEAVIKLSSGANWPKEKAMIEARGDSADNISIRNFQLDGNKFENSIMECGAGNYNLISLRNCSNVNISDMYIYRSGGDSVKVENCQNVKYHNNITRELGGYGVRIMASGNVDISNNNIAAFCASGLGVENSDGVSISKNIITSGKTGARGIEIGSGGSGTIDINTNKIYELSGDAIACLDLTTTQTRIHHNIIHSCGGGVGVYRYVPNYSVEAIIIDFNTIDSNRGPAVNINAENVLVMVRNNIFSNNKGVSGKFVSQNNCFATNAGATERDIPVKDAGFADPTVYDYHLKSKAGRWNGTRWVADDINSPCIDKGMGILFSEPYPHGCKPNPGRYGNTTEASLSGDASLDIYSSSPDFRMPGYFSGSLGADEEARCLFESSEARQNGLKARDCPWGEACYFLEKGSHLTARLMIISLLFLVVLIACARILRFSDRVNMIYKIRASTKFVYAVFIFSAIAWILLNIALYIIMI